MNELVRLTTENITGGKPCVSSREIAEKFKKEHKTVLRKIDILTAQNCAVKKMFTERNYVTERGRNEREFLITRDGFSLLAMGFTGDVALQWKIKFIEAFNFMEKELTARIQTRHIGIEIRKSLTDTIKNCVTDEGNFKNWAYSTYSKLVYKKVLGKDVKKAKAERSVKEKENIRDYLTIEELEKVQDLESKIATFIEFTDTNGMTDKEIYAMVKSHIEK